MNVPALLPCRSLGGYERLETLLDCDRPCDESVLEHVATMPDFAAHVLRTANSESWGHGMPINRLDHAVILLGRNGLRDLVAELALLPEFTPNSPSLDVGRYIEHCVAISQGAALIAQAAELPVVMEAKTAGLLHDIGIQLEVERSEIEFLNALESSRRSGSRLLEHERLTIGTDHCEAGEMWMTQNGLPEALRAATAFHHDPLNAPAEHRFLATILYAAECLARRAGFDDLDGDTSAALEPRVLAELRLNERVIEALVPALGEKVGALWAKRVPALA